MSNDFNEEDETKSSAIFKKLKKIIIIFGAVFVLGLIGYTVIIYGGNLVVDEEDLVIDATTTIETTDGNVIWELYNEYRLPVSIDEIPQHVQDAFIAIEDKRFYSHAGVDFRSVIRAVYRDIIALAKVEGASTITQQLAKNLFLTNDKTWLRKTKEVMAAIYLEREFSKEAILELYLNEIYFGHGVYGVEAASEKFFSKPVKEISLVEGALLAGLAKAPNGYSAIKHPEKALTRRNLVLNAMNDMEVITETQLTEAQGKVLALNVKEREVNPWVNSYVDLVMKEAAEKYELTAEQLKRGGFEIIVAINEEVQQIAYEQFENEDYFPGNTDGVEGAFVMIDQKSGEVISAIGGRDYQLGDLNRVTVKRQPGSTIKPIAVYGPAMMKDAYEPFTLIPDQLIDNNGYTATNYNDKYNSAVSIYESLMESKNAPSVWLLNDIGIDYAKDYLEKMNINIPDKGLAIALGGLKEGLTPLNMVESYRAFANGGSTIESYTIEQIYNKEKELKPQEKPTSTKVFSPQVSWNMTEILSGVVENGTASVGEYSKALAGKTGSTGHPHAKGNYKDAWFVGYTPDYVSALWMGYDHSDADHYLTAGSEFPTKLTKNILTEIDKREPLAAEFTKPVSVVSVPKPINLPKIDDIDGKYIFGGFTLIKGKLTWSGSEDKRVVYRIYQKNDEIDKRIGEVTGKNEFILNSMSLLQLNTFYVVPYDPLTKMEGEHSEIVELSL